MIRRPVLIAFHVSLLSLFSAIVIGLVAAVLTFQYAEGRRTVLASGDLVMQEVADRVIEHTRDIFGFLFGLADTAARMPGVDALPGPEGHPAESFLRGVLETNRRVAAAYLGYENGDFFEVLSLDPGDSQLKRNLSAPKEAVYGIQTIAQRPEGARVGVWRFIDEQGRSVGSSVTDAPTYDPRQRPWYQGAIGQAKTILTDYYTFANSGEVGVTIARRFDGAHSGVLGIDIGLSDISGYLDDQLRFQKRSASATIALLTKDGRLLAGAGLGIGIAEPGMVAASTGMPPVAELGDSLLKTLHARLVEGPAPPVEGLIFDHGGATQIASVLPLPPPYGNGALLAFIAPIDSFVGPIADAVRDSLILSIALTLAAWPILYVAARRISLPLRALTRETYKIGRLELGEHIHISSRIREIHELASTLARAKDTLTNVAKYLPKSLVRQMIDENLDPKIGGERRAITVLFTDVQDFTTLCETETPEVITAVMTEYLGGMVGTIREGGGTVDKFVGDGIMSFWNAPEFDPDHVRNGCLTALRCRQWSNALNERRAQQNLPVLYTRLSVHTGEAIVGNVGSMDRMDYTVMGAPINMGARLEPLNKYYGTQIMVSQEIVQACAGDFVFRSLDLALPKGTVEPVELHELIGLRPSHAVAEPKLAVGEADVSRCATWDEIPRRYRARDWTATVDLAEDFVARYGPDPVADIYLKRARRLIETPPGKNWTGVEIYLTKR